MGETGAGIKSSKLRVGCPDRVPILIFTCCSRRAQVFCRPSVIPGDVRGHLQRLQMLMFGQLGPSGA